MNAYDEDRLKRYITSDDTFAELLEDSIFVDYLNIYLALPVFSTRLFYRRDLRTFEVDPPIPRTAYHFRHGKLLNFVRCRRLGLFFRTPIFHEFKLCKQLTFDKDIPRHEIDAEWDKCKKNTGTVAGMLKFKRFLYSTAGQKLFSFWLDIEKFSSATSTSCLRFAQNELIHKYGKTSSTFELPADLKVEFIKVVNFNQSNQINKQLRLSLKSLQRTVQDELQSYWLPRFISHSVCKRIKMRQRWRLMHRDRNEAKPAAPAMLGLVKKLTQVKNKRVSLVKSEESHRKQIPPDRDQSLVSLASSLSSEMSVPFASSSDSSVSEKEESRDIESLMMQAELPEGPEDLNSCQMNSRLLLKLKEAQSKRDKSNFTFSVFAGVQRTGQQSSRSKSPPMSFAIENDDLKDETTMVIKNSSDISLPTLQSTFASRRPSQSKISSAIQAKKSTDRVRLPPVIMPSCHSDVKPTSFVEALRCTSVSYSAAFSSRGRIMPCQLKSLSRMSLVKRSEKEAWDGLGEMSLFAFVKAGLVSDQIAGHPFRSFLKSRRDVSNLHNLRFLETANEFIDEFPFMSILERQQRSCALADTYLKDDCPRPITVSLEQRGCVSELLNRGRGYSLLLDVADDVAMSLGEDWQMFLNEDRQFFFDIVTVAKKTKHLAPPIKMDKSSSLQSSSDSSFSDVMVTDLMSQSDDIQHDQQPQFDNGRMKRMWRAVELVITMSKPEPRPRRKSFYDDWETESEDDDDDDDEYEGSLAVKQTHCLNEEASYALKTTNQNDYVNEVGHVYLEQELKEINHRTERFTNADNITNMVKEINVGRRRQPVRARPPRPRCFQDILFDSIQLDWFKKFLVKEGSEQPLLFWQAVESMQHNSRNGKARQSRANGIMRRYFGPAAQYGKTLHCSAEIIKDLPHMDKVTPPMLVSAQTCVARSLEEQWYVHYLQTFPEEEELAGITILPRFGPKVPNTSDPTRVPCKQKTRGLWKIFTRNVISFRRGIMHTQTLALFIQFLHNEHKINAKKSKSNGQAPERVVIGNKLIYTEKLVHDLNFWAEVERYKEFADAVVLCAKLGNYTKDDEMTVVRKAKAIVDCCFDSQVPPRVQINVSGDLAENVLGLVQNGIIERGLFHEAALSVFSCLIYYWKRFCLHRLLPGAHLNYIPSSARTDRSLLIKQKQLNLNKVRRMVTIQAVEEDHSKLTFSLQGGIRLCS